MRSRAASRQVRDVAQGFGLVEAMIGMLIGVMALLAVYQAFTVAERLKRNTNAMSDTQVGGMFASFALGMELANAGAGLSTAARELGTCSDPGDFAHSMRPIPVLITDSGAASTPDMFAINYGLASALASTAPFAAFAAAGSDYTVHSPAGIHDGDLIVAISMAGPCASSRVAAVGAPDDNGNVTIAHSGAPIDFAASSQLFNFGPAERVEKMQYYVSNGILESKRLLDKDGVPDTTQVPQPIASNVVNLKLQYGIDTDGDGALDAWVDATGDWAPAALLAAPVATVNRIKAVRLGIVVRSEQFDSEYLVPAPWSMFDGQVSGSILASKSPPGNWRLRTYETIIPLRNAIWNRMT